MDSDTDYEDADQWDDNDNDDNEKTEQEVSDCRVLWCLMFVCADGGHRNRCETGIGGVFVQLCHTGLHYGAIHHTATQAV